MTNTVFITLPGRQPLVYSLCTNKIQASEINIASLKRNKLMMVVVILSFILHLIVYMKIKLHKQKQQDSIYVISFGDHIKHIGISSIDSRALSDFGTSAVSVVLSLAVGFIPTIGNEMNPDNLNNFPYYLFIYFNHFISTNVLTLFTAIIYYLRHPALRQTVIREIKFISKTLFNK